MNVDGDRYNCDLLLSILTPEVGIIALKIDERFSEEKKQPFFLFLGLNEHIECWRNEASG